MIARAGNSDQARALLNAAAALRQHAGVDAARLAVKLEALAAAPYQRVKPDAETLDLLAGLIELAKIPVVIALAYAEDSTPADQAEAAQLLTMRNSLLDAATQLIDHIR
ncbi:MAG: hypothetical protein ACYC1K_02015 [Minisyncoccota bacterium]